MVLMSYGPLGWPGMNFQAAKDDLPNWPDGDHADVGCLVFGNVSKPELSSLFMTRSCVCVFECVIIIQISALAGICIINVLLCCTN